MHNTDTSFEHARSQETRDKRWSTTTTVILVLMCCETFFLLLTIKFECWSNGKHCSVRSFGLTWSWVKLFHSISEGVWLASVNPLERIMEPRDKCVNLTLLSWKQGWINNMEQSRELTVISVGSQDERGVDGCSRDHTYIYFREKNLWKTMCALQCSLSVASCIGPIIGTRVFGFAFNTFSLSRCQKPKHGQML